MMLFTGNKILTMHKYRYILASASPRRKELLAGLNLNFTIKVKEGIDESYPEGLSAEDIPMHISQKKSEAYRNELEEDEILITADTIVWLDGEVLGKPKDRQNAIDMLKKLSGKTHLVVTGVTISSLHKQTSFSSTTEVQFANLTDEEIQFYVEHYSPMDKAGAYGIQEYIGFIGVTSIKGSYFNVMGLPVQRLYQELKVFTQSL